MYVVLRQFSDFDSMKIFLERTILYFILSSESYFCNGINLKFLQKKNGCNVIGLQYLNFEMHGFQLTDQMASLVARQQKKLLFKYQVWL